MQTIQNTIISGLETVKDKLEERDQDLLKRQKIFAAAQEGGAEDQAEKAEEKPEKRIVQEGNEDVKMEEEQLPSEEMQKFKAVSYELLDIGYHYGQQGVTKVKSMPLYQKVDAVVQIDTKFDHVLKQGSELYTYLEGKFKPLVQNVFFLYNNATNQVTSYVNCITDKHTAVKDYVNKTYSDTKVTISGTWMRLDFDNDGTVSIEDAKKSMTSLYDFLKHFDVIETTSQIKSKLYSDAILYMQTELEEDQKAREMRKEAQEKDQQKLAIEEGEKSAKPAQIDQKKTQ